MLGVKPEHRLVMTVPLDQRFVLELRKVVIARFLLQRFSQQHGLLFELLRKRVVGKKIGQLVAKDGGAAWLQHDNRNFGKQLWPKRLHHAPQINLSQVEHAVVVERTPAAEMLLRDFHGESGLLKDFSCGLRRLGKEIVVKSVWPENDFAVCTAEFGMIFIRRALVEPSTEGLRRKFRGAY